MKGTRCILTVGVYRVDPVCKVSCKCTTSVLHLKSHVVLLFSFSIIWHHVLATLTMYAHVHLFSKRRKTQIVQLLQQWQLHANRVVLTKKKIMMVHCQGESSSVVYFMLMSMKITEQSLASLLWQDLYARPCSSEWTYRSNNMLNCEVKKQEKRNT